MSQENVERFRLGLEDFIQASKTEDWDGWLERQDKVWDPEIEWDASNVPMPDLAGVYHGSGAVRRWWKEWLAAWDTGGFEYELIDAGDRVVLLLDQRMRGRFSGIEMPLGTHAEVATFREGRIVHWKIYLSQAEALEAVGLSKSGG